MRCEGSLVFVCPADQRCNATPSSQGTCIRRFAKVYLTFRLCWKSLRGVGHPESDHRRTGPPPNAFDGTAIVGLATAAPMSLPNRPEALLGTLPSTEVGVGSFCRAPARCASWARVFEPVVPALFEALGLQATGICPAAERLHMA